MTDFILSYINASTEKISVFFFANEKISVEDALMLHFRGVSLCAFQLICS